MHKYPALFTRASVRIVFAC